MKKSAFNTNVYNKDQSLTLENVSSLTAVNYGDTDVTVFGETLPAYSAETGASQFVIEGDGTFSDIPMDIVFADGVGKLTVRYRKVIIENC